VTAAIKKFQTINQESKMTTYYKIFRSFNPSLDREKEIIITGLTLEEAQEHCNDPDTRQEGVWFDGFTEE
tara:strand:+ start:1269 stop:1478 length:210 start_codon:yes stop_codon:yes gene_type:complete